VDYTKNELKGFTEIDDVLNAVSALDSNGPLHFSFNSNANHSGGKLLVTTSIGPGASLISNVCGKKHVPRK